MATGAVSKRPATVKITVARGAGREDSFRLPMAEGMTVLQALDYVYEHLDHSLSFYDHAACAQGICKRCFLLIDGKVRLACRSIVTGDLRVEPLAKFPCVKDLVYERRRHSRQKVSRDAD
jgi:succinate dehydrogenase/fumarate reductase-like Fe-S protein